MTPLSPRARSSSNLRWLAALGATSALVGSAWAGTPVRVVMTGTVEFNSIGAGALGTVGVGESATMSFFVDSDVFTDSPNFPTRGYLIDPSSFELAFDSATLGLQNPLPAGVDTYFVIRNDDPAVDGFFVSTNIDFPVGVPLEQAGLFGQFRNNASVTYGSGLLSSLNILDALGTYDFTGLSVFNWTVDDGAFQPLGIVFSELAIETRIPNSNCPAELATDPVLVDNGGDANIGPAIGNADEPFNVELDCSGMASGGFYFIDVRLKRATAQPSRFGSIWVTGPRIASCVGTHTQSAEPCFAVGVVLPNDPSLTGLSFAVQGYCSASGVEPGRTSNGLVQTVNQ